MHRGRNVEAAAYGPVGSRAELPLCLHMHQKRDREHEKAGRIKNEERDNFAGGGKDI